LNPKAHKALLRLQKPHQRRRQAQIDSLASRRHRPVCTTARSLMNSLTPTTWIRGSGLTVPTVMRRPKRSLRRLEFLEGPASLQMKSSLCATQKFHVSLVWSQARRLGKGACSRVSNVSHWSLSRYRLLTGHPKKLNFSGRPYTRVRAATYKVKVNQPVLPPSRAHHTHRMAFCRIAPRQIQLQRLHQPQP